jgi:phosphoribosylanthranilate isomerase
VDPKDLVELSKKYPFAEWAVLLYRKGDEFVEKPRYPSFLWISKFLDACPDNVNRAVHLCGDYVDDFVWRRPIYNLNKFQRIQLNFRATPDATHVESKFFATLLSVSIKWKLQHVITQYNEDNKELHRMLGYIKNHEVLFDASRGKGLTPTEWPKPLIRSVDNSRYYGYAGGLGPDNLETELPKIMKAAGNAPFWIDMESGVRTNNHFDLEKAEKCLQITKEIVYGSR